MKNLTYILESTDPTIQNLLSLAFERVPTPEEDFKCESFPQEAQFIESLGEVEPLLPLPVWSMVWNYRKPHVHQHLAHLLVWGVQRGLQLEPLVSSFLTSRLYSLSVIQLLDFLGPFYHEDSLDESSDEEESNEDSFIGEMVQLKDRLGECEEFEDRWQIAVCLVYDDMKVSSLDSALDRKKNKPC